MFLNANGKKLFFDVISDGVKIGPDGAPQIKPAIIALHGGPGCEHLGIKPSVEMLGEFAQVIMLDQRGSGFSEAVPETEELSMEIMSADVEALRLHLGLEKINLLGISYGGMLALDYALRYQEALQTLILEVTAPSREFIDQAKETVNSLSDESLREAADKVLNGTFSDDDDLKATLAALTPLYSQQGSPDETAAALSKINLSCRIFRWFFGGAVNDYDVRDRLHEVKVPALIIGGENDWICPAAQSQVLFEKLPNSKLAIIEDGKHMLFNEQKEEVAELVRDFLAAHI
ncbi:MAG: alpha/beta fold hydrolase [Planctomycetota bacterium]|jgi:proline iminopeptidase